MNLHQRVDIVGWCSRQPAVVCDLAANGQTCGVRAVDAPPHAPALIFSLRPGGRWTRRGEPAPTGAYLATPPPHTPTP